MCYIATHSLTLAYQDHNDYPLQHYCYICEERRDPKHWFYHCEVCDTSVHPKCVLGKYPFVKLGNNCTYKKHQHPLTVVQKIYYYPQCVHCGQPCQDLSLECVEHGCNYIVHWKCTKPFCYNDKEMLVISGGSDSDCDNDNDCGSGSGSDNDRSDSDNDSGSFFFWPINDSGSE